MRREGRLLKDRAIDSLLLSIHHFNGLHDRGRPEAVLLLMDRAFELLLKAGIVVRKGHIRERGDGNTYGFDHCVRVALTNSKVKFLTEDQAKVLRSINGLRDAAQHYLVDLSEGHLYFQAQAGVTIFRDVLADVFRQALSDHLPDRVLPLSTTAPTDMISLFNEDMKEIRALLAPGRRMHPEAEAKLRALVLLDKGLRGDQAMQPNSEELDKLEREISEGTGLTKLFTGIAGATFSLEGTGADVSLRITKNEGIAVHLVAEDTPGATVVAVKRVDEMGFYHYSHAELSKKVGLTTSKTTAAVRLLDMQADADLYKCVQIGKSRFDRYSEKAVAAIKARLRVQSPDELWAEYRTTLANL